jgi:beta-galactosidase
MKNFSFGIVAYLLLFMQPAMVQGQGSVWQKKLSDNWKFWLGGAQGAEKPEFDDKQWRTVQIPHDWSIEDIPGTKSPFTPAAINQASTGFTVGGTGWYRHSFVLSPADSGSIFYLQFDGVYMNAEVWVNGKRATRNPYGYTSFFADISKLLVYSKPNVIAVKVRNEGENTRYYSGSGIYRHVWLRKTNPVHIVQWGVAATTPKVSTQLGILKLEVEIKNTTAELADIVCTGILLDSKEYDKGTAATRVEIQPGKTARAIIEIQIQNPSLWDVDNPALYKAIISLIWNGKQLDAHSTMVGFRKIRYSALNGFLLNDKPILLKGGCIHHDNGPLGAKAYDRAEYRKIELLKKAGYNAIRTAHNPPSQALLDACDHLGMLVINEAFDTWKDGKNAFDYNMFFASNWEKDITNFVLRDRNHPSIIMWSTGNEIYNKERSEVIKISRQLADKVRSLDPTRPVTNGINGIKNETDSFMAPLDIVGYNYEYKRYQSDHDRVPERVMYGSESYALDAFENWEAVEKYPWVIGDFVWTSFDYLGEAALGWLGWQQSQAFYPWTLAYCGDIDICGWKRPQSFYRDALWKKNALALAVLPPDTVWENNTWKAANSKWEWHDEYMHWNWENYEKDSVVVKAYSSCEEVELWLNNKKLGRKKVSAATKFIVSWKILFQPGKLKAIGYRGGKKVSEYVLQTSGAPSQISLHADRNVINADGQDLSYVTVELKDSNGITNPHATLPINFNVSGAGEIVAVANSYPKSTESFTQPKRTTWQGKCLVIIKSTNKPGKIVLYASAEGLASGKVFIESK